LQKWINEHGLGDVVDPVAFIRDPEYASQRKDAVRDLHPKPPSTSDNSKQLLQQFAFPGGVKNDQNLGALQKWMNEHGLGDVDPVAFIRDPEYVSQRKDAVRDLHL
jgi:hypothetical protein